MFGRRSLLLSLSLTAALLVAAPALAGGGGGPRSASDSDAPTDQIVIRLAPGTSFDAASLAATAGVKLRRVRMRSDGSFVVKLPNRRGADLVAAITERLSARGDVTSVEADAMVQPFAMSPPSDSLWSQQWDLSAKSAGFYGIDALAAWGITTGSSAITVAVIDTGYVPHGDLADRFVPGYDFIGDPLVANDGDGRDADSRDPGDWVSNAESAAGSFKGCYAHNSTWHGTHVSGTIGALGNNGFGVAGINWVSKIQPLRVLGKCGGYTSDVADAIRWAAGLPVAGAPSNPTPARVVNLSLGGTATCGVLYQSAIDAAVAAGTVVVVAAGNSNKDASKFAPANCNNVITVSATGSTGKRAYYSNYGESVEIAAPGGDSQIGKTILSTLNSGTSTPAADTYVSYQGTSMAAPHVAGVVSLMLSAKPALTPAQVLSTLQSTVTKFPSRSGCTAPTKCGPGILNAGAAVAAVSPTGGSGGGSTPGSGGGVLLPAPGAFGKTSPASLAQVTGSSVTLQWAASSDAASYEYCVDTTDDAACTSPASWKSAGTARSATVSGLALEVTYYWEVRATNATGTTLANSGTWWMFATKTPPVLPGAFAKTSPTSGSTDQVAPLYISWSASAGATSYEVCISTTSGTCGVWTSLTTTAAIVNGLASGTWYYWQIRARNADGITYANSGQWWSFRTKT